MNRNTFFLLIAAGLFAGTAYAENDSAGTSPMPNTSIAGTRGVQQVESAWPLTTHDLVLNADMDWSSSSKLFSTNDTNTISHQHFYAAFSIMQGIELTLSESSSANRNTAFYPQTVESMGDPTIGLKFSQGLTSEFAVGARAVVLIPTSAGGSGLSPSATSVAAMLIASYRPQSWLSFSLNAGYMLDNTRKVFTSSLTPVQAFAANIAQANQGIFGLAAETNLHLSDTITIGPFVEATANVGVHVKGKDDPIVAAFGTKLHPLGADRIELVFGADAALSGKATSTGSHQMPGVAPWAIFGRIAAHFGSSGTTNAASASRCTADTECKTGLSCIDNQCTLVKEVVKNVVQEAARAAPTYVIRGKLTNKTTNEPLSVATVTISGFESTRLAVNAKTGEYASWPLPCGEGLVQVNVVAAGYRDAQQIVAKGADKEVKIADFGLQSTNEVLTGEIRGSLKDARGGQSIGGEVFFPSLTLKLKVDDDGKFQSTVKAGRYQVLISAPHFLTQKKEIEIRAGDVVILNVDMTPRRK